MLSPSARKRLVVIFAFVFCVVTAAVVGFATITEANTGAPIALDPSATIVVNDTTDTIHSPGCATTGTGTCSLRDAILFTNAATAAAGGTNTITIGAGTFNLSITGSGENAAATGDLDILAPPTGFINTLNINGAGAANTIIQWSPAVPAASRDRIIDAHPNAPPNGSITLSITGITFTGGNSVTSSGGVMLTGRPGDITNLTNSVFDSNTAFTNGGVISQSSSAASHDLTITNCVFNNNLAGGGGGAVNYAGLGTVTITNSTFSNNRTGPVGANTGGSGGALSTSGGGNGGTYNVSRNAFINNQVLNATAQGGAVVNTNGTLNISFNRFRGNTVPAPANGITLAQTGGATVNVINANDNWWGQNSGPVANDAVVLAAGGTINLTTWLQLRHSASPSTLLLGGTSTLTADILGRNSGGPIAAGNLTGLPAFPSSATTIFGNPQKGSLSAASTQFVNGQATATFTAGSVSASCGAGGADATADSQTINAAITVQCADLTMTKGNNVANSAVVGQSWTWTLTVTNGGNANAAFTNGQTILTDNLPNSNITYGSPSSNNPNVNCSISTNNLTCTAAVAGVSLAPAGSFTVTFAATGTAPATNINPRAAGVARIDSGSLIVESNESNNDATSNTVTVGKANTSVSIVSGQNPSLTGQNITFTATAAVTAPGAGTPTGSITFFDNAVAIAGCTNVAMTGLTAQCTPSPALTLGNHPITATYLGDTNFNSSAAGAMTGNPQVVTNIATWDGSTSSDWNDATNWATNYVPNSTHSVNLPAAGVTNQAAVPSGNLTVVDLSVNAGRTLNLSGGNLTVNGVLTMNGGNITVGGANLLTIGTGGSISRTSGSILGGVEKIYNATGTFLYPVGTAAGYSPVSVNITALAINPSNLRVSANDGTAPATPALTDATTLNRYWTLTETGDLTANVVFSYLQADVRGTESNYKTIRVTGTTAISLLNGSPCPGAGSPCVDAGANTITVNGLQSFSLWTAGVSVATAANGSVVGRVVTSEGRSVANAQILMIDGDGNTRLARTNPFGYYRFFNVPVGATYFISVRHKWHEFSPQTIWLSQDLTELNFVALP